MATKPLTDEEKWQKDEWDKLILNPGNGYLYLNLVSCLISWLSGPLEYLDDNFADAVIAWSEGHGEYPEVPKGTCGGGR